jgi:plastocyanin
MKSGTLAAAIVLVGGLGLAHAAYTGGDVKDGGTISGEVAFEGTAPAPKKIAVTKDQQVCGKEKEQEDVLVKDGKVVNAVVAITDIQKGKKLETADVVLDQKQCHYTPHVLLVPAGANVKILNSDGILHNIHTYSEKNPPFNMAQPKFKKEITTKFEKPENVKLTCDAHGWMSGVAVVMDHPYYVKTDETGAFKLTDVPPGEYTLKVWHEKLGEKTEKVKVEAGKDAKVAFKLAAK